MARRPHSPLLKGFMLLLVSTFSDYRLLFQLRSETSRTALARDNGERASRTQVEKRYFAFVHEG